jgi:ribonucleoside-diphosphate reductase beta chain
MSIFEKTKHIDPKYQHLDKYVNIMYRGFWTPAKYEKLIKEVDVSHFFNAMGTMDQEVVSRCILAISIVEDKVKTYWSSLALEIPQTIIGDVGGLFGMSEVTHRRSYHALTELLNVDTDDLEKHDALRGRIEYLSKYVENDPKIIGKKRILKKLVLFTSLVERCSLFTQFYILMSYAYRNRGLKTISALQETTAIEEVTHYSFGIDLINIIKEELPQLWDEYMIELVTDNIKVAYQSELNLIDWFFENGVPDHLTKEEVINFLNYNFNVISKDLGLDFKYPVDDKLYQERNEWFTVKVFTTSEPDFFDQAVSGYASEEEEIDLDDFKF